MSAAAVRSRRACLVLAAAGALSACTSAWQTPRTIVLPRQRLQDAIDRAFPVRRDLAGLAELSLQAPTLTLLPETDRLGAALDWVLSEALRGRRETGHLALDFGLRWDAEPGAIRMADVRVRQLDVDALGPAQQALVTRWAPPLVEQLLSGQVLYRLPPDQLAQARQRGLQVRALRVLPEGLRIDLDSADAR